MAASLGSLKLDDSGGGLVITRRGFADAPQLRYGSTKGSGELDEQEARAPCRRSCYGRTAHSTACILRPASPLQARDTDFIFSDVTAARYKEYAVVKVNKRGLKQSRVLGIDGERFYNIAREKTHGGDGRLEAEAGAVARKEAASSLRDWGLRQVGLRSTTDGTKHPFHLIRDIDHVTMGETPKEVWGSRHGGAAPAAARFTPRAPPSLRQFRCIFRDALLDSHKEYQYWAASEYEAAEIVAKIRHLIRARATSSARPGRESFLDTDDSELRGGGATRRRGYGSVAAEKAHNK